MALEAARLFVRVGADTSEAEAGLSKVGRSVTQMAGSVAGTLGRAGAGLTAAFTVPLVAAATSAIHSAAQFETSMNVIQSVTGASQQSMQALQETALQLGADTKFTSNEIAAGMLEMAKAGMDTMQVNEAMLGVTQLAAAGNIELAQAAAVTSAALNTFGLEAAQADYVANSLAATANASAADISDLSYGIRNAGAVMAASGVEIDTLNTLMGLLTNHGLEASDAATSLKTMHMRLTAPTKKAANLMEELGIQVYDTTGNMRDYREIVGDMTEATAGMSDQQRDAAFATVFGADAIRAANIVVQEGVEGYDAMFAAVTQQGMAAQASAAYMKGLEGAFDALGGSVDSFMKAQALPFLDFFEQIVRGVDRAVDWFGTLPQPVINAALAFAAVLAAAGPIVGILAAVAGAFALLGTAAAPILAVTAAVAGLAAVLAGLYSANLFGFRDTVNSAFASIQAGIESATATLSAWHDQIATQGLVSQETMIASFALPDNWGDVLRFTIGIAAALKTLSGAVTGDLGAARINELNLILEQAFGEKIATRISNIAGHIADLKDALGDAGTVGEWMTALGDFGTDIQAEISGALQDVDWDALRGQIEVELGLDTIDVSVLTTNLSKVGEQIEASLNKIGVGTIDFTAIGSTAQEQIAGLSANIAAGFSQMITFAQIGMAVAMANLRTQFNTLMTGDTLTLIDAGKVGAWAERQVTAAKAQVDTWFGEDNMGSRMLDRVGGTIESISTVMAGLGDMSAIERFNAAIESVLSVFTLIGGIQTDVLSTAASGLTTLATSIIDFANAIVGGVDTSIISKVLTGVADNLSGAIQTIADAENLNKLGESAGTLVSTFINKLTELMGQPQFGADLGTAMGGATVAIIEGAGALAQGVMDGLANTNWDKFAVQLQTFTHGFVSAFMEALWAGLRDRTIFGQAGEDAMAEMTEPGGWWKSIAREIGLGGFTQQEEIDKDFALPPGEPRVEIVPIVTDYELPPGEPKVEIIPTLPAPGDILRGVYDAPIPIPVTPEIDMSPGDILRGAYDAPIPIPVVPDLTIPMEIPPFTEPVTVPGKIQLQRPDSIDPGGMIETITVPVKPEITWEDISWGWGQGASSFGSAGSAALGETVQVVAEVSELKAPAVPPVVDVQANIVGTTQMMDTTGLLEANSAISSTLSGFSWPSLPEWVWPALPQWSWPALPQWRWPPIERPAWIDQMRVPRPDWLGQLLSWSPEVRLTTGGAPTVPGQLASGTRYWRGGLALVGERGPELVNLRRGAEVLDAQATSQALAAGGAVTVNMFVTAAGDLDWEDAANRVARILERKARGLT